jgi:UDP-3-O-[3-hydroxymyristoyl] N-acetylglucosamine deacetylase/3-hydroxyacyl-[acyl-carrier-protein] dehydratase
MFIFHLSLKVKSGKGIFSRPFLPFGKTHLLPHATLADSAVQAVRLHQVGLACGAAEIFASLGLSLENQLQRGVEMTGKTLKGKGGHTGSESEIIIVDRQEKKGKAAGPLFHFPDFPSPIDRNDLFRLNFYADYGTVLLHSNGAIFYTPEHMLGVMLGFSEAEVEIHCKGKETPVADGSGYPFLKLLQERLSVESLTDSVRFGTYESEIEKEYPCPKGFYHVTPAVDLSVRYTLEVGEICQTASFRLDSAESRESFISDIIPARTFITWAEYLHCREKGLVKGTTFESGILIAENEREYIQIIREYPDFLASGYPYLNRKGFRMETELARHKILDLLGDLAINGLRLPRLEINIKNGGHYQNHRLLKDLMNEKYR